MGVDAASIGRAALFLGVPFVLLVFFLQYKWAKVCDTKIQVLVAQKAGSGRFFLASKDGGQVTITNPETQNTQTWPINELATIEVPYPGVGFVPRFMQKSIRMAVVNEGDWEPILNRSPHRTMVASPDVVAFVRELGTAFERDIARLAGEDNPKSVGKLNAKIEAFLSKVSTGSTREIVADPAALGNLRRSDVLRTLATVSTDLMDKLNDILRRLSGTTRMSPAIVYIGLGLVVILSIFAVYQVSKTSSSVSDLKDRVGTIQSAMGIAVPTPSPK